MLPSVIFGDDRLSGLIGHLYDAAVDDSLWSGMAARIAAAFDSTSTVIKLHGSDARVQLLESTDNLLVPERLQDWATDWQPRFMGRTFRDLRHVADRHRP